MTITGAMRSNKRDIPQELLLHSNREDYWSICLKKKKVTQNVYFMTLLSYVTEKLVILLSTEICGNGIAGWEQNYKSEVVQHHNRTKGALDAGDEMTGEYL